MSRIRSITALFFALASQEVLASTLQCSVNGASDWQPISYRENNQLVGSAVEVLYDFQNHHAVRFVANEDTAWIRILHELENGDLDIIAGVYFNEERARKFRFSLPFAKERVRIFVPSGQTFSFSSKEDLIGKTGLRPASGSYGELFDSYAKDHLEIQEISDNATMFRMMLGGRADYIVLAEENGLSQIDRLNLGNKVTMLSVPVVENDVHFLISLKSPCLNILEALNLFIKNRKAS